MVPVRHGSVGIARCIGSMLKLHSSLHIITLVNVNAPVVATTSWWLHFTAPVVA